MKLRKKANKEVVRSFKEDQAARILKMDKCAWEIVPEEKKEPKVRKAKEVEETKDEETK